MHTCESALPNASVNVPIFERDVDGAIRPNFLFHRAWDKVHSRCIEYPFAASRIAGVQRILDVGTAKADYAWRAWLESLPLDVHATDYDEPVEPFERVSFHRADVRALPFEDGTFDKILAVSVIEHIGLASPQVVAPDLPAVENGGDVRAVQELARVLRPGGELVMTLPFGAVDRIISGGQARAYTLESLRRFESVLEPWHLEYYEYQLQLKPVRYEEYPGSVPQSRPWIPQALTSAAEHALRRMSRRLRDSQPQAAATPSAPATAATAATDEPTRGFGLVTWRRLPLASATATHRGHIDGVVCGTWRKRPA